MESLQEVMGIFMEGQVNSFFFDLFMLDLGDAHPLSIGIDGE